MFRGLYTATSGMIANNRNQQILTNNLSNANTPGFKQDQTVLRSFPAQLIKAMGTGSALNSGIHRNTIGTLHTGVYAQEAIPSFIQGALKETGKSTDISILDENLPINPVTQQRGTVLFAVEDLNNEVRYTRNGNFTVNEAGILTTGEGYAVLNQDLQPIVVNSATFTVEENGQVILNDGSTAHRLWLGYTETPEQLVMEGHGLMRWEGNEDGTPQFIGEIGVLNTFSLVKQGFVEQSNVDLTQTMTQMMNTYRSFESNQKVLQAYDQSMDKAVNEIGRIY